MITVALVGSVFTLLKLHQLFNPDTTVLPTWIDPDWGKNITVYVDPEVEDFGKHAAGEIYWCEVRDSEEPVVWTSSLYYRRVLVRGCRDFLCDLQRVVGMTKRDGGTKLHMVTIMTFLVILSLMSLFFKNVRDPLIALADGPMARAHKLFSPSMRVVQTKDGNYRRVSPVRAQEKNPSPPRTPVNNSPSQTVVEQQADEPVDGSPRCSTPPTPTTPVTTVGDQTMKPPAKPLLGRPISRDSEMPRKEMKEDRGRRMPEKAYISSLPIRRGSIPPANLKKQLLIGIGRRSSSPEGGRRLNGK